MYAGYMHQNQPVIDGLGDQANPVRSTTLLAARALRADTSSRGPGTLADLYAVWLAPVTP